VAARCEAEGAEDVTDGGVAGHGTSSPYDVHATLIAAGPDFKEHAVSDAPTGNVDMAPTLLKLLGLAVPQTMSGRVLDEALRSGPLPSAVRVDRTTVSVATADGSYRLTAHLSSAAGRQYLDDTEVARRRP